MSNLNIMFYRKFKTKHGEYTLFLKIKIFKRKPNYFIRSLNVQKFIDIQLNILIRLSKLF